MNTTRKQSKAQREKARARARRIRKAKHIGKCIILLPVLLVAMGIDKLMQHRRMALVLILAIMASALIGMATNSHAKRNDVKAEETTQAVMEQLPEETAAELKEVLETEKEIYGCELVGQYEFPFDQMSQDWSGEEVKGFYYHEISEESKAAGGHFPVIAQIYTYIVCKNYGVDYEMVFALIEQESKAKYDAVGDDGKSVGYMQINTQWHQDRMARLNCTDMKNPYSNILVGVDYLAELQTKIADTPCATADLLAAYNYGLSGAKKHLWDNDKHWYKYNEEIIERMIQLKDERNNRGN